MKTKNSIYFLFFAVPVLLTNKRNGIKVYLLLGVFIVYFYCIHTREFNRKKETAIIIIIVKTYISNSMNWTQHKLRHTLLCTLFIQSINKIILMNNDGNLYFDVCNEGMND